MALAEGSYMPSVSTEVSVHKYESVSYTGKSRTWPLPVVLDLNVLIPANVVLEPIAEHNANPVIECTAKTIVEHIAKPVIEPVAKHTESISEHVVEAVVAECISKAISEHLVNNEPTDYGAENITEAIDDLIGISAWFAGTAMYAAMQSLPLNMVQAGLRNGEVAPIITGLLGDMTGAATVPLPLDPPTSLTDKCTSASSPNRTSFHRMRT